MKKLLSIFFSIAFLFISSCSKDKEYDKTKAISAFAAIDPIKVDPALEKIEITIPSQIENQIWYGSNNDQNSRVENFAFDFLKSKKLRINREIWSSYNYRLPDRFVFSPVIKDNKVFLLDSSGNLSARDLSSKKKIWKKRIFPKMFLKNYQTPKIGYFDGKIFAIAGINKISTVSDVDGKILWSKDIASIPISTPISDGNLVYVSTNDNKLYAFNITDGELQWVHSGILRTTAIFGVGNPVIYKNNIIVSYSSGEIYALNKKTGEPIWYEDLNVNRAVNSDFYLNDVDATPLVKNDIVYAIGNGGFMMAIDVQKGGYLWKKEIAGVTDFWLAGDFLFVINNDNKLLAIDKKSGGIKWISQLANFKKETKPETKIIYDGVVMAGDKLLISSTRGEILIVSPLDGKIEQTFKTGEEIYHSPVIVNGKIYLHTMGRYLIDLIEIE